MYSTRPSRAAPLRLPGLLGATSGGGGSDACHPTTTEATALQSGCLQRVTLWFVGAEQESEDDYHLILPHPHRQRLLPVSKMPCYVPWSSLRAATRVPSQVGQEATFRGLRPATESTCAGLPHKVKETVAPVPQHMCRVPGSPPFFNQLQPGATMGYQALGFDASLHSKMNCFLDGRRKI